MKFTSDLDAAKTMISSQHPDSNTQYAKFYIGYWAASRHPESVRQTYAKLPHPEDFIDPSWDPQEKAMVLDYLYRAAVVESWRGFACCRLCDCNDVGWRDFGDGVYAWPESFAHYIERNDFWNISVQTLK